MSLLEQLLDAQLAHGEIGPDVADAIMAERRNELRAAYESGKAMAAEWRAAS